MDTTVNGTPRKRHILIVDDDISLAWSFKLTLEHLGYDATIVPDGSLALKYVLGHILDAIVCDLQGFRLEGDLLYATVERSNPALAQRFIFIAGQEQESSFERFAHSAALPVLHKPVAVDALVGEVVRVVERDELPA
jgi:DNA-binding NtrC family response regulator